MKRFLLFASILLFVLPFSQLAPAKNNHTVSNGYTTAAINGRGVPAKFTTIVKPEAGSPVITNGPVTGIISACVGTASASPYIQQFTVSGSNLTGNITATAPAGFEITAYSGSRYSSSITLTQANGTINNIVVYVRAAASAAVGPISGNVVLTSPGTSASVAVKGKVNALPVIDPVPNQGPYLSGTTTKPINFTGTGNTFNWVNDTPGIGLAASGTGDIASFTAINNTSKPITATITATTVNAQYAYVANLGSNAVSVINTTTNTVVAMIPVGSYPNAVAISPDNSLIYTANNESNNISEITAATGRVATIPVGKNPLDMVLSPDGSKLYVESSIAATLWVFNTQTNLIIGTVGLGETSEGIAVSPDGSRVYITNANTSTVQVINTATYKIINNITVGLSPIDVVVSQDGSLLYVANQESNTISVVDIATGMVTNPIPVGMGPVNLALSPDGSLLYVVNQNSNTVSEINTTTNKVVSTIPTGGSDSYGISVTPDGSFLYIVNIISNDVSVINTYTNSVVTHISVGDNPYSWGNFITKGPDCTSDPIKFTITVNPSSFISAGAVTGNISACEGSPSVSPNIQQFAVSGNNLSGDIIATAPTGFEVSLTATSGYSNSVMLSPDAGIVSSTVLYVRSAASAPAGNIKDKVMLTSPGVTTQLVTVTGVIEAAVVPTVFIGASGNNICTGTAVTFTATPYNGGTTPVYQWLVNGHNAGTNNATFSSSTLNNGDMVTCMMTSNAPCVAPASIAGNEITINVSSQVNVPAVSITASENNTCAGSPVTFTATPVNGGSNPAYQWMVNGNNAGTNSATFASSTLTNSDVVTCVMTSGAACSVPASVTSNGITMIINALPVVNAGGNKTILVGKGILLNATAPGNITDITWSPATGLSNYKILNPVASPSSTITYTLTVQTTDGCVGSDMVTVQVTYPIVIPNAFTPNGDGRNDTWDIKYLDTYSNCKVQIFNRWGQLLYSSTGYGIPWDGTYKGSAVPSGTYYYVIDLMKNSKPLAGYVTVLR